MLLTVAPLLAAGVDEDTTVLEGMETLDEVDGEAAVPQPAISAPAISNGQPRRRARPVRPSPWDATCGSLPQSHARPPGPRLAPAAPPGCSHRLCQRPARAYMARRRAGAAPAEGRGEVAVRVALRAVFLDFDETLQEFDSSYVRAVERAIAPLCGGALAPSELRRRLEAPWAAIWEGFVAGRVDEPGLWAARGAAAREAAGLPADAASAAAVSAAYAAAMEEEVRLFPDAEAALEALEAARPRPLLGVLTNGPAATQRARLRRHDLERRFDLVLISGEFGRAKPHPAFFAEALRRAGTAAAEAVMIGDNPVADVAGAKAAGLAALWLNRGGRPWPAQAAPGPDAVCRGLGEAVAWVLGQI